MGRFLARLELLGTSFVSMPFTCYRVSKETKLSNKLDSENTGDCYSTLIMSCLVRLEALLTRNIVIFGIESENRTWGVSRWTTFSTIHRRPARPGPEEARPELWPPLRPEFPAWTCPTCATLSSTRCSTTWASSSWCSSSATRVSLSRRKQI